MRVVAVVVVVVVVVVVTDNWRSAPVGISKALYTYSVGYVMGIFYWLLNKAAPKLRRTTVPDTQSTLQHQSEFNGAIAGYSALTHVVFMLW